MVNSFERERGARQSALLAALQSDRYLALVRRLEGAALRLLIEREGERRRNARQKWPNTWTRVKKSGRAAWN